MGKPTPNRGGIVLCRDTDSGPEFLLITAKRQPDHWVLPKGHIDGDEQPETAALRELTEETGCEAEILAPLGLSTFRAADGELVTTAYFLARHLRDGFPIEDRQLAWLPFAAAYDRLTFDESRNILEKARQVLNQGDSNTQPDP